MPDHYQLTDIEFEQQFKNASFDPQLFNHEAHLRLAWIHVNKYGVERAVQNITSQLRNYTEALGFVEKYHETVTVAAIRAVNHFVSKSAADCFKGFIAENGQLKISFKELLDQHYSTDIFTSENARKKYLKPERLPF